MKNRLRVTSLATALAMTFPVAGAWAQVVGQSGELGLATNIGNVTNIGSVTVTSGGTTGLGASISIGAAGVAGSTSITAINDFLTTPQSGFSYVNQDLSNEASISNTADAITLQSNTVLSDGSSISSSAIGAIGSASISANNVDDFVLTANPVIPSIEQIIKNQPSAESTFRVTNISSQRLRGVTLAGDGSAISIGATGAAASLSVSLINSTIDAGALVAGFDQPFSGPTMQGVYSEAIIRNQLATDVNVGNLAGAGSNVSVNATGASASISGSSIGSSKLLFVLSNSPNNQVSAGSQNQWSTNHGSVTNNPLEKKVTAGDLSGNGSAVQVSAIGASASVNSSEINVVNNTNMSAQIALSDFSQGAYNYAAISNKGLVEAGNLEGNGASVGISAIGANTSIGASSIGSQRRVALSTSAVESREIFQTVYNFIRVQNSGRVNTGNLSGNGASTQIAATGASASFGMSSINGSRLQLGDVNSTNAIKIIQQANNVDNPSRINNSGSISVGDISGHGASAQISAAGASASVSVSGVNSGPITITSNMPALIVEQNVVNGAAVSNGTAGNVNSIGAGDLSGVSSSASVSAIGANSSYAVSSISGAGNSNTIVNGPITSSRYEAWQRSINYGAVSNFGSITTGEISGTAASVQIAAVGASASSSMLSIGTRSGQNTGSPNAGASLAIQTVRNTGAIRNVGTIRAGMVSGVGSSISISATGASASASFTVMSTN
ncbi:MAG: hypothetical protein ABJH63_18645 [Rhizobiaceae bacterium]